VCSVAFRGESPQYVRCRFVDLATLGFGRRQWGVKTGKPARSKSRRLGEADKRTGRTPSAPQNAEMKHVRLPVSIMRKPCVDWTVAAARGEGSLVAHCPRRAERRVDDRGKTTSGAWAMLSRECSRGAAQRATMAQI
jgi:hypothetical protein